MKNLLTILMATLPMVANASQIVGYDCSNATAFNAVKIAASIRFGADGSIASIQTSDESNATSLKQANSVSQSSANSIYVFTANGIHPLKNTEDGAIVTVNANNAGYISYRGITAAISCAQVVQ